MQDLWESKVTEFMNIVTDEGNPVQRYAIKCVLRWNFQKVILLRGLEEKDKSHGKYQFQWDKQKNYFSYIVAESEQDCNEKDSFSVD